jgi:undecaprenyl phosphate N,N'-diacetylbacillosamine 1-phosphate transferase
MFDDKGNLLSDNVRLTLVGRIIRTLSIDELPQLLNILKGEMSFIGPRPLLLEYLPLYTFEQMKRHDVIPGISGYAQVNGRNLISWKEKFKLDLYYVENQSFFLDLKILILTFKNVFSASGVNSDINITMEKFNGKN